METNLSEGKPPSFDKMFEEIKAREQLLYDKWLREASTTWDIYSGRKSGEYQFNILYSNTEILVPATFSQLPIPVVRRRFGDSRANAVCEAAERYASYVMDTNLPDYPNFACALESAVLDAALPGQGLCRVRLVGQVACLDYVPYDRLVWGYARRWEDLPWLAFSYDMTKDQIIKQLQLDEGMAAQIEAYRTDTEAGPTQPSEEAKKAPATYRVYELWDKRNKVVRYLSECVQSRLLKEEPDPFQLQGFYPCPPPLKFVFETTSLVPAPLWNLYKEQANELARITVRINRVIRAMQVRGLYNGRIKGLVNIFQDEQLENALVPSEEAALLSEGGLEKQIWMVPIEKFIIVLRELLTAREAIKATIYETLGIGDILRGVSKASETLGAQQIKDRWGSLRIKKAQARVADFARGCIRLMVELGAKHTPEEQWAGITGLPYMTQLEVQAQQQALALAQSSGQPMPQLPQRPIWSEVLATLQSDLGRSYMIDIETNSTVDAEATQDKQDLIEFMNALGQAMSGLQGLAVSGPEGFEVSKQMLLVLCKKFRLGREIEGPLEALKPPQPGGSPEQLQQAQEAMAQKEQELKQLEEQLAKQYQQLEKKANDFALDRQRANADAKTQQAEMKVLKAEMEAFMKTATATLQAKATTMQAQARAARPPGGAR